MTIISESVRVGGARLCSRNVVISDISRVLAPAVCDRFQCLRFGTTIGLLVHGAGKLDHHANFCVKYLSANLLQVSFLDHDSDWRVGVVQIARHCNGGTHFRVLLRSQHFG